MKEIKIEKTFSGGRLDRLLFKYLDAAPAGFIYKMLRKKNIVLNDKKAAGGEILKDGDVIKLYLADETIEKFKTGKAGSGTEESTGSGHERNAASAEEFRKFIIYEDENIIAANKPAGLLSQKAKPQDISLNDMLLAYLGETEVFTPGIANRLDRNTAGIVLAGKNMLSGRLLGEAVKNRRFAKLYLALAQGYIDEKVILEGYLVKDKKNNRAGVYGLNAYGAAQAGSGGFDSEEFPGGGRENADINPEIPKGAQPVKLSVNPLIRHNNLTLLEAGLITGKSHQIRAQLSAFGRPLIGDYKYGNKKINEEFKRKYGLKGQFLCAYKIIFNNMEDGLSYLNGKTITAPLPEKFEEILKGENLCQPGLQEACGALSLRK